MGRRLALATAILALATAAGGCGGDDEEAPSGGAEGTKPTRLTVQETAGVPSAFVDFGIEKGIFDRHGLRIELEPTQGGAATIPALISGDVQVGGSNAVSLLLAAGRGLPLRAIAGGTSARGEGEKDFGALLVTAGVDEPADLEGKTVAVNTLDNIAEVVVKASLEKEGVDASTLKLSEVPFPEMGAALENGDVDAAFNIEPFVTQSVEEGAEVLNYSYVETEPEMQVGAYAVTTQFAQENADVVRRYQAAVAETAEYVATREDEFRTFLSEQADIPRRLAERIVLPRWTGEIDAESLQSTAELMQRYGIVDEPVSAQQLLEGGGG
jgi:NitT/TauT family transport system substrate-binding protein